MDIAANMNDIVASATKADWDKMQLAIKSCSLCEGLNSHQLGTLNAPGYGNKGSKVVFIGQSLCGRPCIDAQIPFTGGSGKLLDADDNYRVLRRLQEHPVYSNDDGSEKLLGIYLDVESTGLDYTKDSIIELGMIRFEFSREGKIFRSLETFDAYVQDHAPQGCLEHKHP